MEPLLQAEDGSQAPQGLANAVQSQVQLIRRTSRERQEAVTRTVSRAVLGPPIPFHMQSLMAMGFSPEQASQALEAHGNDLQLAATALLADAGELPMAPAMPMWAIVLNARSILSRCRPPTAHMPALHGDAPVSPPHSFDQKCGICLEFHGDARQRPCCVHSFHRECMLGFLESKLRYQDVLETGCPGCNVDFPLEEIQGLLSHERFQRWQSVAHKQRLERDPTTRYCYKPECGAVCGKAVDASDEVQRFKAWKMNAMRCCAFAIALVVAILPWLRRKPTVTDSLGISSLQCSITLVLAVLTCLLSLQDNDRLNVGPRKKCICPTCGAEVCDKCRQPWHPTRTCDSLVLDAFEQWALDHNSAPCPRCKAPTELIDGCNHITCRCTHEFCWICGADWISHPCRNGCPQYGGVRKPEYWTAVGGQNSDRYLLQHRASVLRDILQRFGLLRFIVILGILVQVMWLALEAMGIQGKIPQQCTLWFDGCNNCTVSDRRVLDCSSTACSTRGASSCLEFFKSKPADAVSYFGILWFLAVVEAVLGALLVFSVTGRPWPKYEVMFVVGGLFGSITAPLISHWTMSFIGFVGNMIMKAIVVRVGSMTGTYLAVVFCGTWIMIGTCAAALAVSLLGGTGLYYSLQIVLKRRAKCPGLRHWIQNFLPWVYFGAMYVTSTRSTRRVWLQAQQVLGDSNYLWLKGLDPLGWIGGWSPPAMILCILFLYVMVITQVDFPQFWWATWNFRKCDAQTEGCLHNIGVFMFAYILMPVFAACLFFSFEAWPHGGIHDVPAWLDATKVLKTIMEVNVLAIPIMLLHDYGLFAWLVEMLRGHPYAVLMLAYAALAVAAIVAMVLTLPLWFPVVLTSPVWFFEAGRERCKRCINKMSYFQRVNRLCIPLYISAAVAVGCYFIFWFTLDAFIALHLPWLAVATFHATVARLGDPLTLHCLMLVALSPMTLGYCCSSRRS